MDNHPQIKTLNAELFKKPIKKVYNHLHSNKYYYTINNNKLIAAGILLYDDINIYYVSEYRREKISNIDPGGRFEIEDYDIIQTAAREFCEETFFTIPITYFLLKDLIDNNKVKKIFSCMDKRTKTWQYICYLIHIDNIKNFKFDKQSIKNEILKRRNKYREDMMVQNNNIFISTISFNWVARKDFNNCINNFSNRLIEIVKYSDLIDVI